MKGQLWETRPLEFWAKAKELRARWQKSIESKEKVVGQGNNAEFRFNWVPAFPAITLIEDNPVGSMMQARESVFARKARLASEIRGWGRELCGYVNNCWGAQFLGYQADGSPFPQRKLVVPVPCPCDQHTKRGQQVRDFENVPQWSSDRPVYFGPHDEQRDKPLLEHRVYCNLKIINDIERIFGQKCDDEKLTTLFKGQKQIKEYAIEISLLMARTIPSPLSVKDLYSVFTIGGLTRGNPEDAIAFWKMVRDEVKWRADNLIAAVGNERFRWIEAHPPPWHFLKYYRYMEQYGAVCLGSQYSHVMSGMLEFKPDGSIGARDIPAYPDDTPVKTREDVIRVAMSPEARRLDTMKMDEYVRRSGIVEFAEIFQADGAILPVWRHGVGCTLTRKEQAMYLKEAGLSVMHYEGSQPGDRTDLDEMRLLDQLDSWMQSLGLRRIEAQGGRQ